MHSSPNALGRPAIADYPPGARLPARVIDDFELVWMLRGRARFVTDNAEVVLAPGQLLLVPPGLRHGFIWDERQVSRHGYVHFGPGYLDAAGSSPTRGQPVRLQPMTPDDPLAGLCAYLLWLGQDGADGWRGPAAETLRFLLGCFVSGPLPRPEPLAELASPLVAAVEHLRLEWSRLPLRRMEVGELARAVSVSRSYLSRLFRAGFGLGAASALERARCARAETLLTRTDLKLAVIATQCGFADLGHFSHRFGAIYGMAPSSYRAGGLGSSVLDHPGVRRLVHLVWA